MGAIAAYIYNLNIRLYTVRIMMNDKTVINRPPSRVTAHRGMESQKPTLLILSMISWAVSYRCSPTSRTS